LASVLQFSTKILWRSKVVLAGSADILVLVGRSATNTIKLKELLLTIQRDDQ